MSVYGAAYGAAQGAGDQPARPPVVREHIVASKEFFAAHSRQQIAQVASEIVRKHWGDISQFMLGQRQMGLVLPASYKRKDYSDISLEYQRLSNQETLILTAYPEADNPSVGLLDIENDYDGYFIWTHCEANPHDNSVIINGSDFVPGPFDVYFNEYLLEPNFAPARPFGGYLLLFGETALLSQSAQDKPKKSEFLKVATRTEKPNDVLPRPGWGVYNEGTTQAGVFQPKTDKVLGYWVFDWQNPLNPCMSMLDPTAPANNHTWSFIAGPHGAGQPDITKGLWFERADKSPLNHKGSKNTFYIALSPGGKSGEVVVAGQFLAEFYDRDKGRSVKQSWTKDMRDGLEIIINDSPLRWGVGYNSGAFFSGAGVTVDLTPNSKANGALGPHDGVPADGGFGDGFTAFLSPADVERYRAWQDQVNQMIKDYNDSIQHLINDWQTKWTDAAHLKLINQAQNVTGFWQAQVDANGNRLPNTDTFNPHDLLYAPQDDGSVVFGPFPQQYYYSWNAPYTTTSANPLPRIANRYFFDAPFGHPVLIDTQSDPGNVMQNLPLYGGSIFGDGPLTRDQAFDLAAQYVKDSNKNALLQKQNDYDQIAKDHPPPKLPDRPALGKDYKQFSYKTITGGSGSYSFPEKFSGGN